MGITYAGMDVIMTKRAGKGFRETINERVLSSEGFTRFRERVDTMKEEFAKNTSSGVTRGIISEVVDIERPEWDTVSTIESRSREELGNVADNLRRNLERDFVDESFTEQEKREMGGVVNITNNKVSENDVENKQAHIEAFEKEISEYEGRVVGRRIP